LAKKIGVKVFKDYQTPERDGVYFRLLCMTGDRKGFSFIIESTRIVLGRSKDADIKVMDVKSSREHAELTKYENTYIVTDLGSQNGLVVNDLKVTQHKLNDGDLIVIGATVFKFNILNIKNSLSLIEKNLENEDDDENEEDDEKSSKNGKKKKNSRIIYLVVIIGLMYFFMFDEEPAKVVKKTVVNKSKTMASRLKSLIKKKSRDDDKDLEIRLNSIIHKGHREFREQNYFRALEFFNLALNLDPQSGNAEFYLNKTQQKIDSTIKQMFSKAKREADQLKYHNAIQSYCSIIRYLRDYSTDQRYIDAKVNIEFIEVKMGLDKGETACLQK